MTWAEYEAEMYADDLFNAWREKDNDGMYADEHTIRMRLQDIEDELAFIDDDVADGELTAEDGAAKRAALETERAALEDDLRELEHDIEAWEAEAYQIARWDAGADRRPRFNPYDW